MQDRSHLLRLGGRSAEPPLPPGRTGRRPGAGGGGVARLLAVCLAAAVWCVRAGAATLTLPGDAGAGPGASAAVALSVDDASGFLGTDLVVTYDPAVAVATGVSVSGLSTGQVLTYNLSPPGLVRISLYGPTALSGGGTLLTLALTSTGPPGSSTVLDLAGADLNEGGIAASLVDGLYCVQGRSAAVTGVALAHVPATTAALLAWDPHPFAARYNVYRGSMRDLADLACFLPGVGAAGVQDGGSVPAAGTAYFYLVTAVTCSGESSAGTDSAGVERTLPSPCP